MLQSLNCVFSFLRYKANFIKKLYTFQVREDPAKSSFGLPYYAPDPDPSRPAPHVPITRDPFSHPSNGNPPFDLFVQQHQQQQQQFEASVPQPAKGMRSNIKEINQTFF